MRGRAVALLEHGALIAAELTLRLQRMIGFRSIAVQQYQELNLDIVESGIREGLDELLSLAEAVRPRLDDA